MATMIEQETTMSERERILNALSVWIKQRPGLEYGNYASYGDNGSGRAAYFAEVRSITRDLHDARELLNAVALRPSIAVDALKDAFRAFSGRLRWCCAVKVQARDIILKVYATSATDALRRGRAYFAEDVQDSEITIVSMGAWALDYTTGQYWPTEYRRAVCAVLRTALWDRWRADAEEAQKQGPRCDAFPDATEHPYNCGHCHGSGHEGPSVRDRILKTARAELSRGVYARHFRDA